MAGNGANPTKDGLARYNVHSIAIQVPISMLQQSGKDVSQANSILDQKFVNTPKYRVGEPKPLLPRIAHPTLLIHAEDDPIVPGPWVRPQAARG